MSFAEQLKQARTAAGLTQQQISDILGVTNSTYCGYETGKRQPDISKIKQLAEILHVSCDILLETAGTNEVLQAFKALRPEFQAYVLEQMRKLSELQNK